MKSSICIHPETELKCEIEELESRPSTVVVRLWDKSIASDVSFFLNEDDLMPFINSINAAFDRYNKGE
jgi:hypothetical protein